MLIIGRRGLRAHRKLVVRRKKKNVRLYDYLCIGKLKRCCPGHTFGPNCQKCSSCNNHGTCDGSGTRSGSGDCVCHEGYTGEQCEDCVDNFYKVTNMHIEKTNQDDLIPFSCLPCHEPCSNCDGPGPNNCTGCRKGYKFNTESRSCTDINECELGPEEIQIDSKRLCPDGTYCVNTDGHYKCSDCHRSCLTCMGYGRDKCISCYTDHYMDENRVCIRSPGDSDPAQSEDEYSFEYIWQGRIYILVCFAVVPLVGAIILWTLEKFLGFIPREVRHFFATTLTIYFGNFMSGVAMNLISKAVQNGNETSVATVTGRDEL